MNLKPRIIRALLWLYPAEWRAEYGDELGMLLSLRPITLSVVVDVFWNAARERSRRGRIWKICGTALFVWTVLGIYLNNAAAASPEVYNRHAWVYHAILLLVGCSTAMREGGASPSHAAAKAALFGVSPELAALVLWAAGIFHPLVKTAVGPFPLLESRLALFDTNFPTAPQPGFGIIPIYLAIILVQAWIFGFIGGLLGRALSPLSCRFHVS